MIFQCYSHHVRHFPTAVARNMCNWCNYDFIQVICVTSLAGAISSLLYLLKAISDLVVLKAEKLDISCLP